jgi:hypothetical protein
MNPGSEFDAVKKHAYTVKIAKGMVILEHKISTIG